MLSEALIKICLAEDIALLAIRQARQEAQESVDAAVMAGKEKVASTLARAESEIAHMKRMSDQKATQEAMELASATANRLATLRARAERRLDDAVSLIIERIVKV